MQREPRGWLLGVNSGKLPEGRTLPPALSCWEHGLPIAHRCVAVEVTWASRNGLAQGYAFFVGMASDRLVIEGPQFGTVLKGHSRSKAQGRVETSAVD